jgi:transmembrane sensor
MKANNRLEILIQKYLNSDIDLKDQDELFELLLENRNTDSVLSQIEADLLLDEDADTILPPQIAEDIIVKIVKSEPAVNEIINLNNRKRTFFNYLAFAASFIGLVCLTYFTFNYFNTKSTSFATIIPQNIEYRINNTKAVQQIVLSDSSVVYLEPNSILHFDKSFKGNNREVYLEGEAFFKVKKNPRKPFLVYYNNIVTKVLGTSFRIGTNKLNGQFIVEVSTGRVQVSENSKFSKSSTTITPVIITPNQKVSYDQSIRRFETSIVSHPTLVINNEEQPIIEPHALLFDQQKLSTVFSQLEKYYKIDITVENAAIYNCVFTGDISHLDLFSALKIITITTNAEYEVNGTKILIKGKGCN